MNKASNSPKRKRSIKKILLWTFGIFFMIVSVGAVIAYYNFNKLLTAALIKSFNSSTISDVYELKFEKLSVNFLTGNVKVYNVGLQPREKPLHNYPYINSSFRLSTKKMSLENVELFTLIKSNILKLDKIEIAEPLVELKIADKIPIFIPFKDSTTVAGNDKKSNKKPIESYSLKEFDLVNASFHVTNYAKEREFKISKFDISLKGLSIDQHPGRDIIFYKNIEFSIGEFIGNMQKNSVKHISFKDFKISIDSLHLEQTIDTQVFHFADFTTGVKNMDVQTEDSIFHLSMESFNVSYKEKSIKLTNLSFKPNISDAALQKMSAYQKAQFSGTVGSMNIDHINFDSLIYKRKLLISQIVLDKVSASIFKDKTKPFDKSRFPIYFGQQIKSIPMPLEIKQLKATNVNLVSSEVKPDGSIAKAHINRITLDAKNITNFSTGEMLTIKADAFIENKAHVFVTLGFSYAEPQFSIDGRLEKFDLAELNPLIKSYTPASIKKGIVDEITFSGIAYHTNSTGTMKFLYHDLEIDLALHEKAKWKSAVLTFAANTYIQNSNPASSNLPPRIVQFHVERDMNKGFVNILIKSVLMGLKETFIMSKENKQAFHDAKKDAKKQARKDRKNKKE